MILHKIFKYKINVCKEVIWWNYFDHEHLDVVHKGYKKADIIYEDKKSYLAHFTVKAPLIPFLSFDFPVFGYMENDNKYVVHSFQFGIKSKATFTTIEKENNETEITMDYKFDLGGFKIIFYPILSYLIKKWNHAVWLEDLPIKYRREKVKRLGFKDFHGLPDKIEERKYEGKIHFELPIKRPRKSPRDKYNLK